MTVPPLSDCCPACGSWNTWRLPRDCPKCPPGMFELECQTCGEFSLWRGNVELNVDREDLPRFYQDVDKRPYIWDLEE